MWSAYPLAVDSLLWIDALIGSLMGEREDEGARISLPAVILITRPLSLGKTPDTISIVLKLKQWDRRPFLIATFMEIFSIESISRSSVKHGSLEGSISKNLAQENNFLSFGTGSWTLKNLFNIMINRLYCWNRICINLEICKFLL